jgi:hypothetical protein
MKYLAILPLLALPAMAAVTGTVMNRTTGRPQAGATVGYYTFNGGPMQKAAEAKTDAQGNFTIDQTAGGRMPAMLRVEIDGVTYNHMIPPGTPANGLTLDVYNASKQPGAAKISKHMIMFAPSGGQMAVTEIFLFENPGKTTWFNPAGGTLQFYVPEAAQGKLDVQATAPDGMPVPAPAWKTSQRDVYAARFEIKPGETTIKVDYSVPYTDGAPYTGKIVSKDENTYLVAANGVTLKGDGLNDLGVEPKSQAHIYGLTGTSYKIELSGAAVAAAADDTASAQDDGPQIEQIMPRIYSRVGLILAMALGILAIGFVLLYRSQAPAAISAEQPSAGKVPSTSPAAKPAAKEGNGRGRR